MSTQTYRGLGTYSFLGLMMLLLVITLTQGVNYMGLVSNFVAFLFGSLDSVPNGKDEMLSSIISNTTALVLLDVVVALSIANIIQKVLGASTSFAVDSFHEILDRGPVPLFLIVLLEEVVTRLIPLGILAKLFPSTVAFYVLFILGNGIWAVVHLTNYGKTEERSLLRVLPQFVGGLFLSYLFVRYGFFVALMAHFLYNVLVLSMFKEQKPDASDQKLAIYYVVVSLIGVIIMTGRGLSLGILGQWFTTNNSLSAIDGLTFWDYVLLLIVVNGLVELLAAILVLDHTEVIADAINPGFLAMSIPIGIAIIFGVNWVASLFISNAVARAVVITVAFSLLSKTTSGSALARSFLVNLPGMFIIVVAYTTLGFWSAIWLSVIFTTVEYIPTVLRVQRATNRLYSV